jgi:subtilisin family serine protease
VVSLVTALIAVVACREAPEVQLLTRTLSGGIDPALIESLEAPGREPVYAVLRFESALTRSQHAALRGAGIELLGYLHDYGYTAAIPRSSVLTRAAFDGFVGADRLLASDKIDPRLARRIAASPDATLRVVVEFFTGVDPTTILGLPGATPPRAAATRWTTDLSATEIAVLAEEARVKRVGPAALRFLPLNATGRRHSRTNSAQQSNFIPVVPIYSVDGEPVSIGIFDTGIDEVHDDFRGVGTDGLAGVLRVQNTNTLAGEHGTLVASIAAGSGFNSEPQGLPAFRLRGHAPNAQLGDYQAFTWTDTNVIDRFQEALGTDEMHVTNHSYGESVSVYDSRAADLDRIVRGDPVDGISVPPRPQVWAAGNNGQIAEYEAWQVGADEEGYYSVLTTAKNTISVGSVDALDSKLSDFSSLGPTFDGRIKPDVTAPGCETWYGLGIRGAKNGTQDYMRNEGTSFAAPAVTGVIALMMHQYYNSHDKTLPALLPSAYKAMLVHTAVDLIKTEPGPPLFEFQSPDTDEPVLYHAGPDFATGWGRVDADAATEIIRDDQLLKQDSIEWTGDEDEWCIEVPEGAGEIKATLAWDDPPPDSYIPIEGVKLVNDLDLLLVKPGCPTWWPWFWFWFGRTCEVFPWTLEPPPIEIPAGSGGKEFTDAKDVKPARRGVDRLNNVEMANDHWPKPGTWRVRVTGYHLPFDDASSDGPQQYSLVTSHSAVACVD